MTTIHERAAQANLEKRLAADPGYADIIEITRQRLAINGKDNPHRGFFGVEYPAMVGQVFRRVPRSWPAEQVHAFIDVHVGLVSGRFGRIAIEVGEAPWADADKHGNAAALAEGLAEPFVAELDLLQKVDDQDGFLRWDVPIIVQATHDHRRRCNCNGGPAEMADRPVGPWRVPLEVGYTLPSRTLVHLMQDGGVARWPYGSNWIWLLVNFGHPAVDVRSPAYPTRFAAIA